MKISAVLFFLIILIGCHAKDEQPAHAEEINAVLPRDSVTTAENLKGLVRQYPDSVELLGNLMEYYADNSAYDSAKLVLQPALKADSLNPVLWDMQSAVETKSGDTAAAIRSLTRALRLSPDPRYLVSLGALYAESSNPKALSTADALLKADPSHASKEAFFIKGLYYSYSGMKEKSLPFFDDALKSDFQFMDAYVQKSLALYDLGKFEDAADVIRKAVNLQNNYAEGYFILGECYEKLNRKPDAAEQYKKALLYDPNYDEASDALNALSSGQ